MELTVPEYCSLTIEVGDAVDDDTTHVLASCTCGKWEADLISPLTKMEETARQAWFGHLGRLTTGDPDAPGN